MTYEIEITFEQWDNLLYPLLRDVFEAKEHGAGKHQGFKGRRYRRGKNRCHWCGARLDPR